MVNLVRPYRCGENQKTDSIPPLEPVEPPEAESSKLEQRIRNWAGTNPLAQKSLHIYENNKRYVPATFFLGGVAWDSATLNRIDAWFDSFMLLSYLIILGVTIVLAILVHNDRLSNPFFEKHKQWFAPAIQFFLGALFSAYFVFYLQSTSFRSGSIVFIILLISLLIANEFLQNKLLNTYLLFTLYFFVCVSFFTFFIPVITKQMGYGVFLLSCILGLVITSFMLLILHRRQAFEIATPIKRSFTIIVTLSVLLNIFYLLNWIPPVPLSMKEGNIYRNVQRIDDTYQLSYAKPPWHKFWVKSDRTFYYTEGDTVFCFSAIFAPTNLKSDIFHIWQYYDEGEKEWIESDNIQVDISGGRDGGYRTFTRKRYVQPGKWRVDIRTQRKQILGRIPFTVVPADSAITQLAYENYN